MTYFYDFYLYQGILFLDFWLENNDGCISYWASLKVNSIANGFEVIDNYKRNGNTVRRLF